MATEASACGRAALAGHPSDGYGGAVMAMPLVDLRATSTAAAEGQVVVGDSVLGPDLPTACRRAAARDLDAGDGLAWAAALTLRAWAEDQGVTIDPSPLRVTWSTDIPRAVGLAGSTAIVVATMRALAGHWGIPVPAAVVAGLALRAETEHLDIVAGMQDRMVVALERPLFMDFSSWSAMRGVDVPAHAEVSPVQRPCFVVAWDETAATPSGTVHRALRDRVAEGPELRAAMDRLPKLAVAARAALIGGSPQRLAVAMEATMEVRRTLGIVDDVTDRLARAAADAGAAAVSAGSGGAVIALPGDPGDDAPETVAAAINQASGGATARRVAYPAF